MRIIIISCVFPPEPVVSAQTSFQIAERLVARGDEVIVIAPFPNRPAGKIFPGYRRRLFLNQVVEGINVIRCFNTASKESTVISRLAENISFGITSGLATVFSKRPDVIFLNTWPIIATGIIWCIARFRRIPLVISVQDVYPESLVIQQRASTRNWWVKLLRKIDAIISRGCNALIVISQGFASIYLKDRKVDPEKIYVIPNWVDSKRVYQFDKNNGMREKYHIPTDGFVFVFGGNIGVAAGVETVIEAFSNLPKKSDVYLLIAGEGSNLAKCKELVSRMNISNVIFHSPWLFGETSAVLSSSDILLLPTQGNQSLVSMPSKIITYMLSGRSIIAQVHPDSECAHHITKAECGWVVTPDTPHLLVKKMEEVLKTERVDLDRMGERGRKYALGNFSTEVCLPKVLAIIDRLK